MERLVIIDHAAHQVYFEDVDTDMLEKDYGGSEEKYIEDMYAFDGDFSWDYITNVYYIPNGDADPLKPI